MNTSIFNFINDVVTNELPEIKYVGLFRNQFMNQSKERPINYPALLIEIPSVDFEQNTGYSQFADVNIIFHIGMQVINNIERGDKMVDNSLHYIELVDRIWNVFDGISDGEDTYKNSTKDYITLNQFVRTNQILNQTTANSIWYSKTTYRTRVYMEHYENGGIDIVLSGTTINYDQEL